MAINETELFRNFSTADTSECLILRFQDFIPWNNSENLISFQTENVVRNMKVLVFLPVAFLVGVPANVLNMAVFRRQGLNQRVNVCLFALSLADCGYLMINMLTEGEQLYIHFTTKERYGPVNQWIVNHHLVGFYGFAWVSQVLSAIVASERCFCILQPLKSQTILRTSTMAKLIAAIFLIVTGLRFVVITRYYLVCAYDPVRDTTMMTAIGSDFYYSHKKLIDFLDILLYGLGLPWLVIMVVMVTTVVTVVKLRQAAEWRAGVTTNSNNVSARDIALTRMLVGNSILFIICVIPVGLFRVSLLFLPEMNAGRRHHNLFVSGLWLSNIFSYINATFNIVIYYTMGSSYRHTVRVLLCRHAAKDAHRDPQMIGRLTQQSRKVINTQTG